MAIHQELALMADDFTYIPVKPMVYGDTGRYLDMTINDYTIPAGSTAEVKIHRPNNTFYAIPATITNQVVTCLCDQMLTEVGLTSCTLSILSSGLVVSSFPFKVNVLPNNYGDPSVTEQGISLEQMVQDISDLQDKFPVQTPDIADGAVTTPKLADGSVTIPKLADAVFDQFLVSDEVTDEDIASIPDGAKNVPVKELVCSIVSVQSGSGDPSPDNVRPISGWTGMNVTRTGVNVWDEEVESGYISAAGNLNPETLSLRSKNFRPCIPSVALYGCSVNGKTVNIAWYDKDQQFIQRNAATNAAVTAPANAHFFKVSLNRYVESGTAVYGHDVSINLPATDTTYHSSTENEVYPISWQTEAGTVYGGTLDVTTGVLTVTMAVQDLGALGWNKSVGKLFYTNGLVDLIKPPADDYSTGNALCSSYELDTLNNVYAKTKDCTFGIYWASHSYAGRLMIYDSSKSELTTSQFETAMSGVQLVYELATPTTYQLTPTEVATLLGTNNAWCDTGKVELLDYYCDTKLYIAKVTA